MRRTLLELDGYANILLGLALALFPAPFARILGLPGIEHAVYPSLFGAVLIGIGVALLIERFRRADHLIGLGLSGALIINLCFGIALAAWLTVADLALPFRGYLVLWILVAILVGLGTVEFWAQLRHRPNQAEPKDRDAL